MFVRIAAFVAVLQRSIPHTVTAVFLDFATLGSEDLDLTPLRKVLPDLQRFDTTAADAVTDRIADAEFVFVNKVRLGQAELSTATSLRYIGVAATGTDIIDKAFAGERGIVVTNIRAYCTRSVVEHVIGVLLMMTHSLPHYRDDVSRGIWQRAKTFSLLTRPIQELSSLTLGIVGYGVLGRAVATAARQFGMRVLISRRPSTSGNGEDGRVDFDTLLREADVLTLHCPLTETTRKLLNATTLARMKPGAYLINTARGGLVDSGALVEALESRHLAGAAIDVLTEEPPVSGDPLLDYEGERLILTPHIAWSSRPARQQAVEELAANVAAFQAGEPRCRIV